MKKVSKLLFFLSLSKKTLISMQVLNPLVFLCIDLDDKLNEGLKRDLLSTPYKFWSFDPSEDVLRFQEKDAEIFFDIAKELVEILQLVDRYEGGWASNVLAFEFRDDQEIDVCVMVLDDKHLKVTFWDKQDPFKSETTKNYTI